MGLTVSRKTAKTLAVRRKNVKKNLTISNHKIRSRDLLISLMCYALCGAPCVRKCGKPPSRPPVFTTSIPTQNFGESVLRVFWRENEWQPAFCGA